MNINEIQEQIITEFTPLEDWFAKYEFLINLGKALNPFEDQFKTDEYAIKGCQSRVWIKSDLINGKISLTGDSDTLITKGILSLLIRVFNNQTPADISNADVYFPEKIGLSKNLSPSRANGMGSMIKQIKNYARDYNN